jgi:hypothetical protein
LLVAGAFVDGVALRALGLEDLLSGLGVAGGSLRERRHRRRREHAERDLEGADGEEEANYNFWFALWTCAETARTRFFL